MFILISRQIVKMTLMLLLGFFCSKKNLITHEGSVTISNLLLFVITPPLIIVSFQMDYEPRILLGLFYAFVLSILTHVIGILISTVVFIRKDPAGHYAVERFSSVFSNCGFMGIPLISALFGAEGVIYLTAYVCVFNFLSWTYGYALMTGSHSLRELKGGLLSPVIFSIFIGFALFIFRIHLPEIIYDTCSYVSNMNTPAAMLLAGATLAESDLRTALGNTGVYRVAALRLAAIPLITLFVFLLFPIDPMIRCIVIIGAACPAATSCTLFALRYKKNYVYASQIFALVTAASLFSIPLIVLLCDKLM